MFLFAEFLFELHAFISVNVIGLVPIVETFLCHAAIVRRKAEKRKRNIRGKS